MSTPHIGVMGTGSVGGYVGGCLLAAGAARVTFVGRPRVRAAVARGGLTLRELDAAPRTLAPDGIEFATDPRALAACDAVLVCVKSGQTAAVARALAEVIRRDALVVSLQNGLANRDALARALPGHPLMAAVVSFNVVSSPGPTFHRTMDGPLMLEAVPGVIATRLADALEDAGLPVDIHDPLAPHQWTKLVVNLNNAVVALTGLPTAQVLASPQARGIIADIVSEALAVLRAAGIKPARLRGVPVGLMPAILRWPTPLVRLVLRAQMTINPEARSSMWEDLSRGRPTEVDYLNGEVVRLAASVEAEAPLNRRIVELVHAAEARGAGSPKLTPDGLRVLLEANTPPRYAPPTPRPQRRPPTLPR